MGSGHETIVFCCRARTIRSCVLTSTSGMSKLQKVSEGFMRHILDCVNNGYNLARAFVMLVGSYM